MQKQISQQIAFSLLPDVTQLEWVEFVLVQWLGRITVKQVFFLLIVNLRKRLFSVKEDIVIILSVTY